ncbi:NAD(P)/FAD-dependent oxidoreductase [Planctomycetota bacterium]
MESTFDVIVVGAGAAGLLASISAAESGLRTIVLEKNRKPGAKILMSGGTRCNVTHDTDHRGIVDAFGQQGRFLKTAIGRFGPQDVIQLLANEGVATKVESTGKVFPTSDRAVDVLQAILDRQARTEGELLTATVVRNITLDDASQHFVVHCESKYGENSFVTRNVILTTGGMSFPGCGTTGDGYAWAKHFGHQIVQPLPALVPLKLNDEWTRDLSGITIPDAGIHVILHDKRLCETRGSLLFTHFGVSGPCVLDASRAITTAGVDPTEFCVELDLAPAVTTSGLESTLKQSTSGKRTVGTIIAEFLPKRIVNIACANAGVQADRRLAELPRQHRIQLVQAIKAMRVAVAGTMGFKKAEVTTGGVSLDSVNPKTMSSKLQKGLYFAGEILDVDGPIGGYNFQAAFSTGWLAGKSIAKREATIQ